MVVSTSGPETDIYVPYILFLFNKSRAQNIPSYLFPTRKLLPVTYRIWFNNNRIGMYLSEPIRINI